MEYGIVTVAAAPVRRKADHRQEMVNQLLFGEIVKVLKTKGNLWVKISSLHDNYIGWMTINMIQEVDVAVANTKPTYTTSEIFGEITSSKGSMAVPVGSSLPFYDGQFGKLGSEEYTYTGVANNSFAKLICADEIKTLTKAWLNVPYLWGGRTPLGVDCSGFVQIIFKQLGFDLPRDAWQQAKKGKRVVCFSDVQCGDLAFFGNKKAVSHVGILLGNGTVIHSSGKVRIDAIDKKGIVNMETGKRGVKLLVIKRVAKTPSHK